MGVISHPNTNQIESVLNLLAPFYLCVLETQQLKLNEPSM